MSKILTYWADHVKPNTTWWLILECGHWFHWTGQVRPKETEVECSRCEPSLAEKEMRR